MRVAVIVCRRFDMESIELTIIMPGPRSPWAEVTVDTHNCMCNVAKTPHKKLRKLQEKE